MKIFPALAVVTTFAATAFVSSPTKKEAASPKQQKIQAAILLDVSNSMDGLIAQAKAQLWNMVSVMGRTKCDAGTPKIEIALYEYGRKSNDGKVGYIKQISPFTSDLDQLSRELFGLTTNGGEEYCGHVIYSSLNELNWDTASTDYKVIFIAGNEDFLQGDIPYTRSCDEARKKGVIVNTIYCGDRMQGIREHWNLAGECGSGSFTNIDQDATIDEIPTPYDSALIVLNDKFNSTYLGYGSNMAQGYAGVASADQLNMRLNKATALKRTTVKANNKVYNNAGWDLVDAWAADSIRIRRSISSIELPDSLKGLSPGALEKLIKEKGKERTDIENQITQLSRLRAEYIANEKAKSVANKNNMATLETEIERIIKEQVKRFNMVVE